MQIYVLAGLEVTTAGESQFILYSKGDELIRANYPFFPYSPDEAYLVFPSVAIKIGRLGKEVAPRFVHRYVERIGIGFDIVAHHTLRRLVSRQYPWDRAVAFHDCCAVSFPEVEPSLDLAGALPQLSFYSSLCPEGIGSFAISERELRQAVSFLSYHRKIRQGDILLLHPSSPAEDSPSNALRACRESAITATMAMHSFTLRIK